MQLPLLLLPSGSVPPFQRWRLVDTLFSQRRPLLFGSAGMLAAGLICWLRTRSSWFLVWDALVLVATVLRLVLADRYRRRDLDGCPDDWARRYLAGVSAFAVLWGLAALAIPLLPHLPYVHFVIVAVLAGYNGGGAIRNNASPAAVTVGSVVPAISVAVCCLAVGSLYYSLFALFPLLQIAADRELGRMYGRATLALLTAEREQARLYDRLLTTCGELESAIGQLSELSTTDELTGIANRRDFTTKVESAWRRAARRNAEISLLLVDVDHFKAFNDLFGHPEGDRCLRIVAHTLRDGLRAGDLVARYGGEEFVVLLPQTGLAEAREVAERMRVAVETQVVPHPASSLGYLTISIGVAALAPELGGEPSHLVMLADRALYGAKRSGRNRIGVAGMENLSVA